MAHSSKKNLIIFSLLASLVIGALDNPINLSAQAKSNESSVTENSDAIALKAFATIDDFSKEQIEFALDFADEMSSTSASAQFEILIGGRATPLVLDDKTPVRERLRAAKKNPQVTMYVCAEDIERLRRTIGPDRVKLVTGIHEASCDQKAKQFLREEWLHIDVTVAGN